MANAGTTQPAAAQPAAAPPTAGASWFGVGLTLAAGALVLIWLFGQLPGTTLPFWGWIVSGLAAGAIVIIGGEMLINRLFVGTTGEKVARGATFVLAFVIGGALVFYGWSVWIQIPPTVTPPPGAGNAGASQTTMPTWFTDLNDQFGAWMIAPGVTALVLLFGGLQWIKSKDKTRAAEYLFVGVVTVLCVAGGLYTIAIMMAGFDTANQLASGALGALRGQMADFVLTVDPTGATPPVLDWAAIGPIAAMAGVGLLGLTLVGLFLAKAWQGHKLAAILAVLLGAGITAIVVVNVAASHEPTREALGAATETVTTAAAEVAGAVAERAGDGVAAVANWAGRDRHVFEFERPYRAGQTASVVMDGNDYVRARPPSVAAGQDPFWICPSTADTTIIFYADYSARGMIVEISIAEASQTTLRESGMPNFRVTFTLRQSPAHTNPCDQVAP